MPSEETRTYPHTFIKSPLKFTKTERLFWVLILICYLLASQKPQDAVNLLKTERLFWVRSVRWVSFVGFLPLFGKNTLKKVTDDIVNFDFWQNQAKPFFL